MLKENERIELSGDEAIDVLKEIELILISLHYMGTYYMYHINMDQDITAYEKETTRFVDEWKVTERLAKIRGILTSKFDTTLGDDDMDDLERAMESLKFWEKPGDMPE